MDPRLQEFLLRFAGLDKIDIPINVKDNSLGGKLSRFGSRIGTPVKNFINSRTSIPNSLTGSPFVNTLGGEVVDVASSTPKSFFSQVKGLPSGFTKKFAGNPNVQKLLSGANNPVLKKFGGPVTAGTLGTAIDLAEGVSPVQALGRNIAGTTAGVIAYPFAEAALPVVPGSGILGYMGADQLGRQGFDQAYDLVTSGAGDPITGGFLGGPLPTEEYLAKIKQPVEVETETSPTERDLWEQKTQYSPARMSGAFTDDELWALQQKHREWKAARGR